MAKFSDDEHWVALSLIPGLGGETYRRLLRAFGEPREIFAASQSALKKVVSDKIAAAIREGGDREAAAAAAAWLTEPGNSLMTLADPDYPPGLLQIPDPPPLLYVKGRRELLGRPALAVVGSRNATPQGIRNAQSLARSLSDSGFCIVSGLALGIDAAAHEGGLAGASGSVAVVGTGLDVVYPARNRTLARELAERGALLSEYPLGTRALAGNFPRRNRLISGLAAGCLIVEAAIQSGSLITARLAAEQGKEVFAIPGSIHSPLSKGCHALIKQGAKLVESARDILEELGAPLPVESDIVPFAEGSGAGDRLLAQLGFEVCDVDTLAQGSGLTAEQVCSMLLKLELEGRVASLPGGRYQRIG